jgi:YD repeat-containing protein
VANANGTHSIAEARSGSGQTLYKTYGPDGLTVGTDSNSWKYDNFGRLKSIPGMITSQSYEADGQTKSITYANGVTTNFAYSPTRRWLMEIAPVFASGSPVFFSKYSRDLTGRIATITGQAGGFNTWAYAYDDLGRLTTATNAGDATQSEAFTYAANDNLLSRSRNPLGALAPAGTAPYVYTYPAGLRPHTPTSVAGRAFTCDANLILHGEGGQSPRLEPPRMHP